MPALSACHQRSFRRLCGGVIGACAMLGSIAAAGEMIGPLPPRALPSPVQRPPLAPVTGEHMRPAACQTCRGHCQGGACPGHCPVRPDEFGFYSTQWRTWPTTASQQPPSMDALTPVSPPKSEVPGVDQESLPRQSLEGDAIEAEAAPLPAPRIPVPDRRPATDEARPPATDEAEEQERMPPPPAPKPPVKPAKPAEPAEEENLFDEVRHRLPRAAALALAGQKAVRHQARVAATAGDRPPVIVRVAHEAPVAERPSGGGNPLRAAGDDIANPLRDDATRVD